jgi:hypothetical protein
MLQVLKITIAVICISYNPSYSDINLTFLWHLVLIEEALIPVFQQDIILLLKKMVANRACLEA